MAQEQQAVAATISKASGPVTVERFGETVTLHVGDPVYASDVISTGAHSVVLSFIDGASASLGPQSTMTVQEFSYGDDKAETSFVLNLAQGAMRSISGKVVDQNPDAFKVITPKATAGIRGTDFITKVNEDGSEVHVVIALDQGHNLVVTSHTGGQVSLTSADQGALIGSGADGSITPTTFTDAEVQEIVQVIMAALTTQDGESAEGTVTQTLLLNDATTEALGEENVLLLQEALQVVGIVTSNAEGESFRESVNAPESVSGVKSNSTDAGASAPLSPPSPPSPAPSPSPSPEVPRIEVHVSEDKSYFADESTVESGDYTFGSHDIVIDTDIVNATTVISGDLDIQNGGYVEAGSDVIIGKAMEAGRVVGDVEFMTGGTLMAGNDSITFDSKSGGNSIYGDLANLAGGTVSLGDDVITIRGDFTESVISGDVQELTLPDIIVEKWGDDTILIGGNVGEGASIYGDSSMHAQLYSPDGHDSITVEGSLAGVIYGDSMGSAASGQIDYSGMGSGNDTIFVETMLGSSRVVGSDGNNNITVNTMTGNAKVAVGYDDDVVTVNNMISGELYSLSGEDTFNVTLGETSDNDAPRIITGLSLYSIIPQDDVYNITVDTSIAGKTYHLEVFDGVFDAANNNVFKVNNVVYEMADLQVDSASNDTYIDLENGTKLFIYF